MSNVILLLQTRTVHTAPTTSNFKLLPLRGKRAPVRPATLVRTGPDGRNRPPRPGARGSHPCCPLPACTVRRTPGRALPRALVPPRHTGGAARGRTPRRRAVTYFAPTGALQFGGRRRWVACSQAYANRKSVASLHGLPKNWSPAGSIPPRVYPIGTVMAGNPVRGAKS